MAQNPEGSAASSPKPPVLRQVFPRLTGRNGYEEIVAAGDALQTSRLFKAAWERMDQGTTADPTAGCPLAKKRRVLDDPPVKRALSLLRQGLAKPVRDPREPFAPGNTYPELSHIRYLARLLRIQQQVLLADGRVAQALESVQLGLQLGSAIAGSSVISGLVAIGSDAIVTRTIGAHLDQLANSDCTTLFRICSDWLARPDPLLAAFEAERRGAQKQLALARSDSKKDLVDLFGLNDFNDPDTGEAVIDYSHLRKQLASEIRSPGARSRLLTELEQRVRARYHQEADGLRRPTWDPSSDSQDPDESLMGRAVESLVFTYGSSRNTFTRDSAQIRLFAVHAAILRYRWEHDRLPKDLAGLELGDVAIDPFSGQPFKYEPTGHRYRLISVGMPTYDGDPAAVDGRKPLDVVGE